MSASRVLLVDDEPSLIGVLQPVLTAAGYAVTTAANGERALALILESDPDVVLLDLGLPDMDGKAVIARIRATSEVPIVVLSARHQELEKVAALDEGADDYVNKPFEIGELMARIRAAIRRGGNAVGGVVTYHAGPLSVDLLTRRVTRAGEVVKLSPKEYDLLQILVRHAGQVVTHKRLLATGWKHNATDQQYLRIYIGLLRQKLEEEPSDPQLILTEPGIGYRLVAST